MENTAKKGFWGTFKETPGSCTVYRISLLSAME